MISRKLKLDRSPERQKPIYSPPSVGNWIFGFGVVVFVLFIACAAFMLTAEPKDRKLSIVLSACWVIGVPIFFFLEHTFFFRRWGDPTQFDQFKRLQDQAAKVWAAAIVVLAAFFTHWSKEVTPMCWLTTSSA